jgi:queuine tRNA-ribosyltransferase
MDFELGARGGRITFPRGTIETPAFMPVGTYGTVKAMTPARSRDIGAQIILGNTFHLYLRPGLEVIAAHGGLHGFARWDGPILTDSGGFQVFSLAQPRKITEKGVTFASPDRRQQGVPRPEESMQIQRVLDSDIVMIFDECTPYRRPCDEKRAERESMELSLRWAERSRARTRATTRAVRHRAGRRVPDLRTRSAGGPEARSASTAMPSAASRWASPKPSATRCSNTPRRSCRRIGRAT